MMQKSASFLARNTVHFTVNKVVDTHFGGNWSSVPIVYAMPMRGILDQNGAPSVYCYEDTYWIGDVKIPEGSILWIQKGHYKIDMPPEAMKNIKIIVVDDPVKTAHSFVDEFRGAPDKLDMDQEALDRILPMNSYSGDKTAHHNSSLTKVEYASIDTFEALFDRRRLNGAEGFTRDDLNTYWGIVLRTNILLQIFYGKESGMYESSISERELTFERVKKENFTRIPLGEVIGLFLDDAKPVLDGFDREQKKVRSEYSREALDIRATKEKFIDNLYAIARLLVDNEPDISKYIKLEKGYPAKLLQKIKELKYPGWTPEQIESREREKREWQQLAESANAA